MENPNHIVRLFHKVVADNLDEENAGFFVKPNAQVAYAGHQRSWGVGDLLVRYRGPIEAGSMFRGGIGQVGATGFTYHYPTNTVTPADGLPGREAEQGGREILSPEECEMIFNNTFHAVNGHHQIVLNPKTVLDFIEKTTTITGVTNRVVNIEPFEVMNSKGHFAGKLEMYENELVVMIKTPRGDAPIYIDTQASLPDVNRLRLDQWVVVAPVGIVLHEYPNGQQEQRRIGKIMELYAPGVKFAIQQFKSGLLMPGDARYSVYAGEDGNDIHTNDVFPMKFIDGQDKVNIRKATMLTVQLDTFVRALEALSEYSHVEMLYKDMSEDIIMIPQVAEGEPIVDVVLTPIQQFVSGKVLTL